MRGAPVVGERDGLGSATVPQRGSEVNPSTPIGALPDRLNEPLLPNAKSLLPAVDNEDAGCRAIRKARPHPQLFLAFWALVGEHADRLILVPSFRAVRKNRTTLLFPARPAIPL